MSDVVDRIVAAFDRRDLDALAAGYAEDVVVVLDAEPERNAGVDHVADGRVDREPS